MVEGINPITTKNKTKIELRILAAMHTLCIYPENDRDLDCDKYLNLLINIYPPFHPPNPKRICSFFKNKTFCSIFDTNKLDFNYFSTPYI